MSLCSVLSESYIYRVVHKNFPLFKNSRPYCCHAMGPAMDSPISRFWKVLAQFSQLSAISFAQPCTLLQRTRKQKHSLPRPVKIAVVLVTTSYNQFQQRFEQGKDVPFLQSSSNPRKLYPNSQARPERSLRGSVPVRSFSSQGLN